MDISIILFSIAFGVAILTFLLCAGLCLFCMILWLELCIDSSKNGTMLAHFFPTFLFSVRGLSELGVEKRNKFLRMFKWFVGLMIYNVVIVLLMNDISSFNLSEMFSIFKLKPD